MSEIEEKSREEILWERARENDGVARAESYHELSKIEYDRENYRDALSMCLVAKELYEGDQTLSHVRERIDIYEGLSSIYECLDDCEAAEKALVDAVELARHEESELLGELLRTLGRLRFSHNKWQESIEAHTEAMMLPLQEDDTRSRGVDYLNLGMAYHRNDDFADAVRMELQAMQIFEDEQAHPEWIVNTHAELSASYLGLEDADSTIFHAQKALDWFEMEDNYQKIWVLKYYIGVAYRIKGELDVALDWLRDARDVAKEHSKNYQAFGVDVDKEAGEIFIMQGKVEKGQELIRRSESVRELLKRKSEKEAEDGKHS